MSLSNPPAESRRSSELIAVLDNVQRFLDRVQSLEGYLTHCKPGTYPAQHAAVRRASMDLTRSLAVLRRSSRWHDRIRNPAPATSVPEDPKSTTDNHAPRAQSARVV
jgi:hypothetical protein